MGLLLLALEAGLDVTVHHVDHHARPTSSEDAEFVASYCTRHSLPFVRHDVLVAPGPNFEQRARQARRQAMPHGVLTGHTMDDLVETMVLNLLRGAGADGVSAMIGDPSKPLLAVRRSELHDYVKAAGVVARQDETNHDPHFRRNRVRHELLPLMNDIVDRDVTPLLARFGQLISQEQLWLSSLHSDDENLLLSGADCRDLRAWPVPRLRRWLRGHLTSLGDHGDTYAPSAAEIDRAIDVVRGDVVACELSGGRRLARKDQRLTLE
jgi:tRNA(Ile)-lysidine synthase